MNERFRVLQRQPRRISITLSYHVHEALLSRSEEEGRSVSNLCAFLLEDALRDQQRSLLPIATMTPHSNGAHPPARMKTRSF
jgi:macrodomain Ter protein organizer (MatP/YcbG family)